MVAHAIHAHSNSRLCRVFARELVYGWPDDGSVQLTLLRSGVIIPLRWASPRPSWNAFANSCRSCSRRAIDPVSVRLHKKQQRSCHRREARPASRCRPRRTFETLPRSGIPTANVKATLEVRERRVCAPGLLECTYNRRITDGQVRDGSPQRQEDTERRTESSRFFISPLPAATGLAISVSGTPGRHGATGAEERL